MKWQSAATGKWNASIDKSNPSWGADIIASHIGSKQIGIRCRANVTPRLENAQPDRDNTTVRSNSCWCPVVVVRSWCRFTHQRSDTKKQRWTIVYGKRKPSKRVCAKVGGAKPVVQEVSGGFVDCFIVNKQAVVDWVDGGLVICWYWELIVTSVKDARQ